MIASVSDPVSKPVAPIPRRPARKRAVASGQVGAIPVVTALPAPVAALVPPPAVSLNMPPEALQALLSTLQTVSHGMQALTARVDRLGAPAQVSAAASAVPDRTQVELMQRAVDTQRPNGYMFQLLIVPEDGYPSVEQFITIEELITRIKSLLKKSYYLFPGVGQLYSITKGPLRHLQTPVGAFPLFDIEAPHSSAASLTGWVGDALTEEELESDAANALAELAEDAEDSEDIEDTEEAEEAAS